MQLIAPALLVNALDHFELRELLIEDLTLAPAEDTNSYAKWIMAFWLGSSITRNALLASFNKETLAVCPYLDWGYFCVLTIDRHLSLLQKDSQAYRILHRISASFFLHFNEHYTCLQQAPKVLFYPLIHGVGALSVIPDCSVEEKKIVMSAKILCVELLSQLMRWTQITPFMNPVTSTPLFTPRPFSIKHNRFNLKQHITELLTSSCMPLHPFSPQSFEIERVAMPTLSIYKFLLSGHDGVILEGLRIRQRQKHSDTTVLALVGQLQLEHGYIHQIQHTLPEFFNAEVVLINHRNFSLHASKRADTLGDIVLDVIAFAKHEVSRKKSLVLYGMCGGAGPMLFVAEHLMKHQIPFKIILDRFAESYSSFYDYKTINRRNHLVKQIRNEVSLCHFQHSPFLWLLLDVMAYWFVLLALCIVRIPSRFDSIVQQIPECDLLILQAKGPKTLQSPLCKSSDSRKCSSKLRAVFVDMMVHPEHELRNTVKDQRNQKKLVLKTLKRDALMLISCVTYDPGLECLFKRFRDFFDACLQCIANEKLTLTTSVETARPLDIHCLPLTFLGTRNHLPVSQFIYGFYAKPSMPSAHSINLLDSSVIESLIKRVEAHYCDKESEYSKQFSSFLNAFITRIKNNASFIGNLADRLAITSQHNLVCIIQELKDGAQPIRQIESESNFNQLSNQPG
ncbi:hypothetical protein [Legionella worsleiensis]|uniref:Uncharacterized protein n=1 Tax=Legionella worsleiensis TaxID=45076 RepID=A0A0W1AIJ5_9GAMM|nr:hypothetical protein [Legionella worsleiensis]KTD81194.1 hypothetical protein Lwor_0872 [Legionella worsleiensis]STY33170.1 Uncharacterised protein [Legionella worsleiensis]